MLPVELLELVSFYSRFDDFCKLFYINQIPITKKQILIWKRYSITSNTKYLSIDDVLRVVKYFNFKMNPKLMHTLFNFSLVLIPKQIWNPIDDSKFIGYEFSQDYNHEWFTDENFKLVYFYKGGRNIFGKYSDEFYDSNETLRYKEYSDNKYRYYLKYDMNGVEISHSRQLIDTKGLRKYRDINNRIRYEQLKYQYEEDSDYPDREEEYDPEEYLEEFSENSDIEYEEFNY